jgi:hypothetical protein
MSRRVAAVGLAGLLSPHLDAGADRRGGDYGLGAQCASDSRGGDPAALWSTLTDPH